MKNRKTGKRHSLLLYRRSMDRLWPPTLLLGLALGSVWTWEYWSGAALFHQANSLVLFVGMAGSLGFALFAFLARGMAYVQAHGDHLQIVTPFLRLKIAYRRLKSVHPADFNLLFPPRKASWSQRRFLEPFYGKTAVVLEMNGFPLPPAVLRFFLSGSMFHPHDTGFVLVLEDWMAFSTEMDSVMGSWLQVQGRRQSAGRLAAR